MNSYILILKFLFKTKQHVKIKILYTFIIYHYYFFYSFALLFQILDNILGIATWARADKSALLFVVPKPI